MRWLTLTLTALAFVSLASCDRTHVANAGDAEKREFLFAASSGDVATMRELLKDYPNLVNTKTKNGTTPLHLATIGGHKDAVELLQQHGGQS